MKLSPQTLRPPARMQSPAWFTERRRADWNGFRCAAIPLEPENLENQPGLPETTPQYIISFGICSILCRCAAPPHSGQRNWPPSQNANPRLAHRAQQSGASGILESRPPGASSLMDLGSMKLLPQTLRLPARMPSLAWPSERSRAEPQESSSPGPQGRVV